MKLTLFALPVLCFAFVVDAAACSSSSSTGGGSPGETDGGAAPASQDAGSGAPQDSGGPGASACGTGSFTCGALTCQIATQYCMSGLGCAAYVGSDPCPDCTNPPGECGAGETASCSGSSATGVTITCN